MSFVSMGVGDMSAARMRSSFNRSGVVGGSGPSALAGRAMASGGAAGEVTGRGRPGPHAGLDDGARRRARGTERQRVLMKGEPSRGRRRRVGAAIPTPADTPGR